MCEFNSPYSLSSGHCLDNPAAPSYTRTEPIVQSPQAWETRAAELDESHAAVIAQAENDAAALQADVHFYKSLGSKFIGIALRPGTGPTVKIWEH